MRSSDDLFRLIKSLSKSEKRYFSLQTSLHGGEKNYLELFEAIDRMDVYDEARLKKRFEGRAFTRQFNVAKRYLHDLILRHLRGYHTDFTLQARCEEMLKSAEILHEKGLTDQAERLIDKVIRLAEENGIPLPLLEALQWKLKLHRPAVESESSIDAELDRLRGALDALVSEARQERIMRLLTFQFQHSHPDEPEVEQRIEELMRDPLLADPANALSTKAKGDYYTSIGFYHFSRREFDRALPTTEALISLIEAHPDALLDNLVEYRTAIHNRMLLLRRMHDLERWSSELIELRRKIRAFESTMRLKSRRALLSLYNTLYVNLVTYCVLVVDLDLGRRLAPEVAEWLDRNEEDLEVQDHVVFHDNLALIRFNLGEYRLALHHLDRVLRAEPYRVKDVYFHARLMELIVHFELGNIEVIPYRIRSIYRFYRSRHALHAFESLVLEFFRRLLRVTTMAELQEELTRLKGKIEEGLEQSEMRRMLESFNYLAWIESKVTGRPFVEIYQEQVEAELGKRPTVMLDDPDMQS